MDRRLTLIWRIAPEPARRPSLISRQRSNPAHGPKDEHHGKPDHPGGPFAGKPHDRDDWGHKDWGRKDRDDDKSWGGKDDHKGGKDDKGKSWGDRDRDTAARGPDGRNGHDGRDRDDKGRGNGPSLDGAGCLQFSERRSVARWAVWPRQRSVRRLEGGWRLQWSEWRRVAGRSVGPRQQWVAGWSQGGSKGGGGSSQGGSSGQGGQSGQGGRN